MVPLEEVRKKIPKEALELLEETFPPATFNKMILSFRVKRNTCFRINTLKSNRDEVLPELQKLGFKTGNVHFLANAYQLNVCDDNRLLKTGLASDGKIYLQSISSQIPAFILEPVKGENILDIAASPGSKTTQMSAMMENTGNIDAVEPDYVRMERLRFNAGTLGAANINFFQADGVDFCKDKMARYDRVLADVPCSGEGRFSIHDRSSYVRWKINSVEKLSNLQKKLLTGSILSTKPGGIIVYSTCTLNVFENEKNIDWILKQAGFKVKILPVDDRFKSLNESVDPILKFRNERYDDSIRRCLRIIPSGGMEGFFICKMQRIS
jgi:NOL1/NOP2/sun family putative RNA methylase